MENPEYAGEEEQEGRPLDALESVFDNDPGEVYQGDEDDDLTVPFHEPLNKQDFVGEHNNPIYAQLTFPKKKRKRKSSARYK